MTEQSYYPPASSSALSYSVYTAILAINSEAGGTITPNVLDSTLGENPEWTVNGVGAYRGQTAAPIFTTNKTFIYPYQTMGLVLIPIWNNVELVGYISVSSPADSVIDILTFDTSLVAAEYYSLVGEDAQIQIEIRVYP